MIKVKDIAFVRFSAPDLEQMERFLRDFGLMVTARENDVIYARGTDPSPYLHVTERGEHGFRGVAFEAASAEDLDAVARLEGASAVEKIDAPGGGRCVRFTDPDGYAVEVAHVLGSLGREFSRPEVMPVIAGSPKETADALAEILLRGLEASGSARCLGHDREK
jgi:catechol 2,3-dioxygenase-like lactoylglutathione lyase family enzyme